MIKSDVYIMADQAKEIAKELIRGTGARGYRYAGVNKADPYIVLVNKGVRMNEARKPMKKAQKKQQWWFDIPGAKYIYHGDWSDPEIQYKGFSINYWDVEEGLLSAYRDEHPEDKDDKGFDAWMAEQGGPGGYLEGELDNCIYAALGDDNVEEEPWLGIPDAYKVKEVYGQGEGEFILYKDCLVNVADVDYYDSEYDDWYPYSDNPENFEAYYSDPKNKKELVDKLNEQVSYYMSESTKFNEGWLGDKVKAGWNKVKDGAKKVGKAIGKALNGPFKKGDVVQMSGEDGEKFKGTIMGYDRGEQTYSVMLGR
jgi:hypothetical protein